MTFAQLSTAKAKHEVAAKTARYCGYNAKCVKNTNEVQPYEVVVVGVSVDQCKGLQVSLENLLKYPVNVVCK
jgi:hypothetical protein